MVRRVASGIVRKLAGRCRKDALTQPSIIALDNTEPMFVVSLQLLAGGAVWLGIEGGA